MGFKFLTESFIDPDTNLITFTPSSERTPDFRALNVLNKQRRSKMWRTDGQFIVESTKNVMVFQEDGATDLYATITVGTYSSIAAYSAAVKAAFEAASVNSVTYTVTQDSDLKFVITSNGNGGATFDLILTDVLSADQADMMGFGTGSDLSGALTYTADAVRIHSEESIVFDLGIASNPSDFVLIGPDRNDPIPLSPGAVVKLQGSPTSNFSTAPIDITLTYDDEVIYTRSEAGLDPSMVGARFWRVYFLDRENPEGTLKIGAIFLGDHMFVQYTNPRTAPQRPFNIQPIDRSELTFAEGGQSFADVKPKSATFGVKFFFKREEYEEISDAFRRFGITTPFFIHMDPGAVIGTSVNRLLRYVQFGKEPSIVNKTYDHFEVDLEFREVL